MPNGGGSCNYECPFLSNESFCKLRNVFIEIPHWTICDNYMGRNNIVSGPLQAVLGYRKNGIWGHTTLPYINGRRPESTFPESDKGTLFKIENDKGETLQFATKEAFIKYYRNALKTSLK